MPVETAADLASLFEEDEFAEGAVYRAPGIGAYPVPCLVILDRGQGRDTFTAGNTAAMGSQRHLRVRAGELAEVRRDGTFTMVAGGEVLKVTGLPKLDQVGAIWSVDLVIGG